LRGGRQTGDWPQAHGRTDRRTLRAFPRPAEEIDAVLAFERRIVSATPAGKPRITPAWVHMARGLWCRRRRHHPPRGPAATLRSQIGMGRRSSRRGRADESRLDAYRMPGHPFGAAMTESAARRNEVVVVTTNGKVCVADGDRCQAS